MTVDKNLFLYDLAVVAILKDEGHYLKEWLDYHLLAGVDHFYLYDNDSNDNQAEVAKPYVEAGLVDYIPLPGKAMQMAAYNDALNKFKFFSRYIAVIDCDEFIYPKSNRSIVEIVDEVLSHDTNAAGLAIHWQLYGSNGQDKADYSRGVLERFTGRSKEKNRHVKNISNPRMINFFPNSHYPIYFENTYSVNENGGVVQGPFNEPATLEKIVINHYHTKSREEYAMKVQRGNADRVDNRYDIKNFDSHDRNEVFDDGILKYRTVREDNFSLEREEQRLARVTKALIKTLSQYADEKISDLETALTCRALSHYLQEKIFEEASLAAILKSLDGIKIFEVRLLLNELPDLLNLSYPAVRELKDAVIQIISQTMDSMRKNGFWRDFKELDNLLRLLKNI